MPHWYGTPTAGKPVVDGRLVPTPTTGLVGFECTSAFMGIRGEESVPFDADELLLFDELAVAGLRYCSRVRLVLPMFYQRAESTHTFNFRLATPPTDTFAEPNGCTLQGR